MYRTGRGPGRDSAYATTIHWGGDVAHSPNTTNTTVLYPFGGGADVGLAGTSGIFATLLFLLIVWYTFFKADQYIYNDEGSEIKYFLNFVESFFSHESYSERKTRIAVENKTEEKVRISC